ncbi:hypothetical protein OXYTRIMIC_377 [Oxytricha trifallax]|uniref:Uncharacterized protein n=1 Tax=Oxytricha trifallax TaxID=1172189 RepID=A0A073HZN9_9SPIT|nr:hypothetical protein OXYTRIMIC_377 [Oxytricha trifallax]
MLTSQHAFSKSDLLQYLNTSFLILLKTDSVEQQYSRYSKDCAVLVSSQCPNYGEANPPHQEINFLKRIKQISRHSRLQSNQQENLQIYCLPYLQFLNGILWTILCITSSRMHLRLTKMQSHSHEMAYVQLPQEQSKLKSMLCSSNSHQLL